jgi:hypothetical protein
VYVRICVALLGHRQKLWHAAALTFPDNGRLSDAIWPRGIVKQAEPKSSHFAPFRTVSSGQGNTSAEPQPPRVSGCIKSRHKSALCGRFCTKKMHGSVFQSTESPASSIPFPHRSHFCCFFAECARRFV